MTLFDKRLLIVGGKGGVGKSVIASALALSSAKRGQKTLLVGIDAQDRFSPLLNSEPISSKVSQISEFLYSMILEPKEVAKEFIGMHVPIRALANKITNSAMFNYWFDATPMLGELLMLGKLWRLAIETRRFSRDLVWDLIVVEAPATGHSIGLLGASDIAAQLLVGPMKTKALEIGDMLRDEASTSLIVVTLPEDMPVNEALELQAKAKEKVGIHLGPMIMNAVYPSIVFHGDDDALLAEDRANPFLGQALEQGYRYALERNDRTDHFRKVLEERWGGWTLEMPWITSNRFGLQEVETLAYQLDIQLTKGRE